MMRCFQLRLSGHWGQASRAGLNWRGWLLCVGLLLPVASLNAMCRYNNRVNSYDGSAVRIPFGNVNLHDASLQPPGTLLASVEVPATGYGLPGNTVLWTCSEGDLGQLYFLVASNAMSRYGGRVPIAANDIYATWFPYVGLRQTMNGVPITQQWTRIPLTTFARDQGFVLIRLQDIPPLHAELYRVAALPPADVSRGCALAMGTPTPGGTSYRCGDPNSYLQLEGPGLRHNMPGEVSDRGLRNRFNGFGYRMYQSMSLSNAASCVVHKVTPVVRFTPISVSELEAGHQRMQIFDIELKCSDGAASGTTSGKGHTAISLQASPGAFAAIERLKMVTAGGATQFLLSDEYGLDPTLAQGVGITLFSLNGTFQRYFARPGNSASITPAAGWYPFDLDADASSSNDGYQIWTLNLTAVLTRLTGQPITPGKVHATAHVQVKVP